MARVCSVLNVPRPERGYWAKLEAGQAPKRPELPEASPGEPQFWSRGDGDPPFAAARTNTVTSAPARPRTAHIINGTHGLIQGAKQHYARGYKVDEEQLLRPYKRQLVDVIASAAGLDKALNLANELFNALEAKGHRVRIAASIDRFHRPQIDACEEVLKPKHHERLYRNTRLWYPSAPTVVYIDTVPLGLTVIEMTEETLMRYVNGKYVRESGYKIPKASRTIADHTWTTTQTIACGRLRLIVYVPLHDVSWSLSFQETVQRTLAQNLKKIVKSIEDSIEVVRGEISEAERKEAVRRREWEEQHERWQREENQRKIAASNNESREQLMQIIQSWATAVSIEQFLKGVEERANQLPESEQARILDRLQLARESIGIQDPLEFFLSWKAPKERYLPLGQVPQS